MAINPYDPNYLSYILGGSPTTTTRTTSTTQAAPPPGGGYDDGPPPPADTAPAYTKPRFTSTAQSQTSSWKPSQEGDTYDDYMAYKAAHPDYVPTRDDDLVGWIVEHWGKEWLAPDGTAPTGTAGSIDWFPWQDKDLQYDPANGQDYGRPQYPNGPGMPSGGYQGTPEEIQAEFDANNWYRNGGKGYNPAMLYEGKYTAAQIVYDENGKASWQNAYWVGPDGSTWQDDHFGKPMTNGIYAGQMPGSALIDAINGVPHNSPYGNTWYPTGPNSGGGAFGSGGTGQAATKPSYRTGSVGSPYGGGTVPAANSYIGLPPDHANRFGASAPAAAKGPWMTQMDNSEAMAQQMAQVAALRGGG